MAWNLVTFLTVPILVIEDIGIGPAFTRSKDLFKQTWGENVVGQAGLGVLGVFVVLPAVALIVWALRSARTAYRARRGRGSRGSSCRRR